MKPSFGDEAALEALLNCFLLPLILAVAWNYVCEDFNLPRLTYFKAMIIRLIASLLFSPIYTRTKTEFLERL